MGSCVGEKEDGKEEEMPVDMLAATSTAFRKLPLLAMVAQ
jgi:hypothetical protein